MDKTSKAKPATVPWAKQAGELQTHWDWTKSEIWTKRMLTALEDGVKGGVWFSLMDKVYAMPTLLASFAAVKANRGAAGIDHQTIKMYERRLEENLKRLSRQLRETMYCPSAVRRKWINKPGRNGQRPLGIPTVQDRIVQTALRFVIEPIFEIEFAEYSYGFRPKRSCKDALRRVKALIEAGYTWVVDADLKSYFDTIPHAPLMALVKDRIADGRILDLIEQFLSQDVMDGMTLWTPETGCPQGAVISPLLSNLYLNPLDHLMAELGYEMIRYADDFVILCRSQEVATAALARVKAWTNGAGLQLHPTKTRIVDASERGGFDFLGYHFERTYRWPSRTSKRKLKDKVRHQTKRTNGTSMDVIIARLNPILRGWYGYFKHSSRTSFPRLDSWVRMRLRSILRKRRKGRGRGGGKDHYRWPNAYFAEMGLLSLVAVHTQGCQSSRR